MKIGLYGGTFDPIHHGHLILARDVLEKNRLDYVYFIPCARSPHKTERPLASDANRLQMLRAAVRHVSMFKVSDYEIKKGGCSYTIETVFFFKKKYPQAQLFWILGADQKEKLPTWHRFKELKKNVSFIFIPRAFERGHSSIQRRLDMSATEIRQRCRAGLSIRYLVPDAVYRMIENKQLYSR